MTYPVNHISFSGMSKYHQNPGGWKEKYILGNTFYRTSPSALVGKMAHAVVELFQTGTPFEQAIEAQLEYLNTVPQESVRWGKTGSMAKVRDDFKNAVQMYFDEMPKYGKVLMVEKKIEYEITDTINGSNFTSPIPLLGIPDIVFEDRAKLIVEDYKFKVRSEHTTEEDGLHPALWMQSMFYYYLVSKDLSREVDEVRFREVKTSKNKGTESQHNVITVNCKSEEFNEWKAYFWYFLLGMCKSIESADQETYLPYNIFDRTEGRDTMELLKSTTFGYNQNRAEKSDLVRMEKSQFREVNFIESKIPDTIEGKIKYKFQEFGVALSFEEKQEGYAFDRYLFVPSRGVKMSEVKKYTEDVSQATELENVRIIAPVPGTKFVGVEVPKVDRKFAKVDKECMPIGRDIDKKLYSLDLSNPDTPHVLVAGKTGSGKSQLIRTLIETRPAGMDIVCIDPKLVELSRYRKTALMYASLPEEALLILQELELEMRQRYQLMDDKGVTEISGLRNRIMVVIDEYASIRLDPRVGKDIEKSLVNITNMGRACGIHLIVATQRPSVDVITGLIKANIGCRICLSVASQIDSKVIMDLPGGEKLSGKGDLLFIYPGQEPVRLQALTV